jgi:drug/metabolite transporter (DMT)-like permease
MSMALSTLVIFFVLPLIVAAVLGVFIGRNSGDRLNWGEVGVVGLMYVPWGVFMGGSPNTFFSGGTLILCAMAFACACVCTISATVTKILIEETNRPHKT